MKKTLFHRRVMKKTLGSIIHKCIVMACHNCFCEYTPPGYVCTLRSICLHHLFEYPLYHRISSFFPISLVAEQSKRRGYFSLDCVKLHFTAVDGANIQSINISAIMS